MMSCKYGVLVYYNKDLQALQNDLKHQENKARQESCFSKCVDHDHYGLRLAGLPDGRGILTDRLLLSGFWK